MPGSSPDDKADVTEVDTDAAVTAAVDPQAAASDSPDVVADPSTAPDKDAASPEKSLLDVTLEAIEKSKTPETDGASSDPKAKADEASDKGKTDAAAEADAEDDPDAKLPFHKHPRWQEVQTELKAARTKAAQFDVIEQFRTASHLSVDEVSDGWKVMALIKNDPGKALPVLEAYAASIREHLGMVLPKDLQDDVDAGVIDDKRALELSQARAANAHHTEASAARQAEDAARQRRDLGTSLGQAVEEWETGVRARDVDYAKKDSMVQDRILAIIAADKTRVPRTREQAVALAKEAYEHVSTVLKGIVPARSSTNPVPSGLAAIAGRAPRTSLEVTKAALGQPI